MAFGKTPQASDPTAASMVQLWDQQDPIKLPSPGGQGQELLARAALPLILSLCNKLFHSH